MKAVILNNLGSFDNLKLAEIIKPKPNHDEVLVKVDYCGVNHLDLLIIEGKRPALGKFPLILGSEIVGRIVGTGEKVAVYPWTYCGKCSPCKSGHENICDYSGTFGRTRQGGYAEYVAVPGKNLVKIPETVDEKVICASTLSATTAYHMIERAKIPA